MEMLLRTSGLAVLLCAVAVVAKATSVILPPDFNYTILHKSAEHCDVTKTREAIKALPAPRKSEAINRLDHEGYAPLGYAARTGCLDVVKLLLKEGAVVDMTEKHFNWTPLLRAAVQRHADVVRYLLDHGADPNTRTRLGETPLSVAFSGLVSWVSYGPFTVSSISYGPKGDRDATVKALLEKRADASPLLAAYDKLIGIVGEQRDRIADFEKERQRLEEERRRLNEIIDNIRSKIGDPGYRPM